MESRVWFPGVRRAFGARMGAMWSLNYPRSRGNLTLASADPLDHPRIRFNLLSDPEDRAEMLRGYRSLRALLAQPALASVLGPIRRPVADFASDEEVMAYIRATAATAYHPSGTCRMGSDARAVVDGELRVRGVERLRVADASIFPRLPGGNTNLPVIMVAERAADFVRKAAVSDQLEIASSRIAMERGSPDQQAFAKQMIESHEKIVADLKRLVSVEKIPVELPVEFDKADETRLDKLKSVEAAKFIAEYTTLQVTKHRNALALFERYAKDGDNMNLKAWARRMLPAIRHDLAAAEKLPRS